MKKRILKSITLLLVSSLIAVTFIGCSNDTSSPSTKVDAPPAATLVMGTNAEFPPFEFVGDNGQPDGFDVALVKEIAKRMDAEIKIENMEFKSLIGSLGNGKIDLVAAGMTVTEERKKEVDFTQAYFTANQMIIIPTGDSIKSASDLKDKVVGVQEGTTGDIIISEDDVEVKEYNVKEVKRYKKGIDAVMDLVNDRIDAVVIDSNPAKEYVASNEGKIVAIQSGMETEEYAMAVKKGNTELLEKVNAALTEIKEDGTYDKLVKEYIQ
ncbi:MAG: basic amino acid ABC transporter substrate-binding protein [Clostridiaceae bacterium]|nr:basic amino acid ABC transporter substrate-binding protein [Clostridiaceae bacterium]